MLSEIAIDNPTAFADLVKVAKDGLAGKSFADVKPAKKETPKKKKAEDVLVELKVDCSLYNDYVQQVTTETVTTTTRTAQ